MNKWLFLLVTGICSPLIACSITTSVGSAKPPLSDNIVQTDYRLVTVADSLDPDGNCRIIRFENGKSVVITRQRLPASDSIYFIDEGKLVALGFKEYYFDLYQQRCYFEDPAGDINYIDNTFNLTSLKSVTDKDLRTFVTPATGVEVYPLNIRGKPVPGNKLRDLETGADKPFRYHFKNDGSLYRKFTYVEKKTQLFDANGEFITAVDGNIFRIMSDTYYLVDGGGYHYIVDDQGVKVMADFSEQFETSLETIDLKGTYMGLNRLNADHRYENRLLNFATGKIVDDHLMSAYPVSERCFATEDKNRVERIHRLDGTVDTVRNVKVRDLLKFGYYRFEKEDTTYVFNISDQQLDAFPTGQVRQLSYYSSRDKDRIYFEQGWQLHRDSLFYHPPTDQTLYVPQGYGAAIINTDVSLGWPTYYQRQYEGKLKYRKDELVDVRTGEVMDLKGADRIMLDGNGLVLTYRRDGPWSLFQIVR